MPAVSTKPITFANNRQAIAALPDAQLTAKEIAAALNVPAYSSLLLLIGGADSIDEKLKPRLTQLFGRGVARAAVISNAVILDGGTQAGVMEMMGEGVAARGYKSSLIGVAPIGLVKYPGSTGTGEAEIDQNHSHFVLVPGNTWGSETSALFQLVAELTTRKQPAAALVVGGGDVSRDEALQAVRQNLPLLIVEGSGGVAEKIASAYKAKSETPADAVIAEIIADGRIEIIPLGNSVKAAERTVVRYLGSDNLLLQAWDTFADYDSNATLQQHRFDGLEKAILFIGLVATALALTKQVFAPQNAQGFVISTGGWWFSPNEVKDRKIDPWIGWWLLKYLLIIMPIVITVLITAVNKFKQGSKWLLLRAGAEAIKREVYRYRTRTGDYGPDLNPPPVATGTPVVPRPTPEQVLAQRLEIVTQRTMQTVVNTAWIKPYDKSKDFPPFISKLDDGFSLLTAPSYIEVRLEDQISYYQRQTRKLQRTLKFIQWTIYIVGGLGTLLAAINQQVWIALTTALAAALTTFLSYRQTENTLMKYNQTSTDLKNVRRWWTALPPEEQAKQLSVNILVDHTERVLQSELDGWVQQMQNALAELRKGQPQAPEAGTSNQPASGGGVAADIPAVVQPTAAKETAEAETDGDPEPLDDSDETPDVDTGEQPPPVVDDPK